MTGRQQKTSSQASKLRKFETTTQQPTDLILSVACRATGEAKSYSLLIGWRKMMTSLTFEIQDPVVMRTCACQLPAKKAGRRMAHTATSGAPTR